MYIQRSYVGKKSNFKGHSAPWEQQRVCIMLCILHVQKPTVIFPVIRP